MGRHGGSVAGWGAQVKAAHIAVDQEAERGHERTRDFKGWSLVPVMPHPQKFPQPPKIVSQVGNSIQNMSPQGF